MAASLESAGMRLGWTGVAYIAMRRFIRMITLTMKKTKLNASRK